MEEDGPIKRGETNVLDEDKWPHPSLISLALTKRHGGDSSADPCVNTPDTAVFYLHDYSVKKAKGVAH
jgi:hypothetical protein